MAKDITDLFAQDHGKPQFRSEPWYNRHGDCVEYHFREDEFFAQRVDGVVTAYLSRDAKELVGCQVKGIQAILKKFGDFGFVLKDDKVSLGMLFLMQKHFPVSTTDHPSPEQERIYNELFERTKETKVEVSEPAGSC